jgi:hypothetical protein
VAWLDVLQPIFVGLNILILSLPDLASQPPTLSIYSSATALLIINYMMEECQTASWCSIVPEHLLYGIAANKEEIPELREAARITIKSGRELHERCVSSKGITGTTNRETLQNSFNGRPPPAHGFECFIYDAKGGYDLPGIARSSPGPTEFQLREDLRGIYNFFLEVFDWKLFDNKGSQLHLTYGYGKQCINAYWNGSQVILGSGSGTTGQSKGAWVSFDRPDDVLAHELTHGIISQTSGLQYSDEPGALNEHLADVFGVLYQQYGRSPVNGQWSWSIGHNIFQLGKHSDEYIIRPAERVDHPDGFPLLKNFSTLRSLASPELTWPKQTVRYPRPPRKLVKLHYDNGGVHDYSGIGNLAFYTAAMVAGDSPAYSVGKVWFRAMTDSRLRPDSKFAHFAALTIDWADREHRHLNDAIVQGWKKVQVVPLLSANCVVSSVLAQPNEQTKSKLGVEPSHLDEQLRPSGTGSNRRKWGIGFQAEDNDGLEWDIDAIDSHRMELDQDL